MKETSIDDIKNDYGETVLNCALINLLQMGKKSIEQFTLREQLVNLNDMYDKLEKENKIPVVSRNFALQVLNCEYKLYDFDDMELLTYFSKNKNDKEDNK
ncbi:MAG: hypothetical protein ACI4TI_00430 [Christensenellales bacterium]